MKRDVEIVLSVKNLVKYFPVRLSFIESIRGRKRSKVHAVDGVSFEIKKGEVFVLAGESGSGKTTVLRSILMLIKPDGGSVFFNGIDLTKLSKSLLKKMRTKIQIIFQDPYESINPRMTVFDVVAEGLFVNNLVSTNAEALELVKEALRDVQLIPPEEFIFRYPHELSGGQRQRVAVARALVLKPEIILADEPVSMLDVSIRAEVLNVILEIKKKKGISILFVTHDLALAKDIGDRLAVMYLGKIVEAGKAEEVVFKPYHPYTQALVAAVPTPDPLAEKIKVLAKGEIPTNIEPPSGCRFHPRCPYMRQICKEKEPELIEVGDEHYVACHFWQEAYKAFSEGKVKEFEAFA